ncbi:MAG: HAD family hydrolase [Bacteroides sp.]|nr:HAD family hydrolase [Eubacterium sp.]MCM1418120.1 HAD family hydrolase [Roseburia sp.]MCM1462256.1 HAD family hydrolase [Bacteroides sp.]
MTLYISDLDGTLLNGSAKLKPRAAELLNDLIENGAMFSYATARRLHSAGEIMKDVKLNLPVILMNGVFLYDPRTGEYIRKNIFGEKQRLLLKEAVLRYGETPMIHSFIDGELRNSYSVGAKTLKSYVEDRRNDPSMRPTESADALFEGETVYAVFINPKNKEALDRVFTEENGFSTVYYADVYHADEYWYEVFSHTASKANAVLQLKELVGADEVVCFGDNGNDLSMFRVADRAYAVENALDAVKAAADGIVPSNESMGVPRFIEGEQIVRFDYIRPEDGAIDEARFAEAVKAALDREVSTIGTQNEKAIHHALKRYYCDPEGLEPKIAGFYADGAGENGVYEIQTASFAKLNKKLSKLLRACHVTVVYPFERVVHNFSINEQTGEILSSSRRTNSSFSKFFLELYRIKAFLTNPNLTICAAVLETEQKIYYRDARKQRRKGMKKEKRPLRYLEEIRLDGAADYLRFLPAELSGAFTKKEAARYTKTTDASILLEILEYVGAVRRVGKRGGSILYERCADANDRVKP